MPDELLIAALAQAEQSDPSVKGIALLHIARVMAVDDRARAEELMEEGIAIITGLPENQRSILLNEAAPLAGTVSPQRAFDLVLMVGSVPRLLQIEINRVILEFISHGYMKEAVEYLGAPRPDWDYPYTAAFNAIGRSAGDPVAQLRILRGAITAILSAERRFADMDFLQLFKWHWKILPEAELAAVVQKLVERFLQEPDRSGNMNSGGGAGQVHFSSVQQWSLFEIFAPLRRAAPDLAESLVRKFQQLSDAVKKYPDGYDERQTEVPAAIVENASKCGVDIEWDDVNFRWIAVSEWVEQILPRKLEAALEMYRFDVTPDPNKDPREC